MSTAVCAGIGVVPSSATAAPRAAADGSGIVYVVQRGDYLYGIAAATGVSVPALLTANALTMTSAIHPGDTLTIPAGGHPAAPTVVVVTPSPAPTGPPAAVGTPSADPASGHYVVKKGDYFVRIATNNGVTVRALLAANAMTSTTAIHPGTTLILPPATLPIPPARAASAAAAATSPQPSAAAVATAPTAAGFPTQYVVKSGDYFVGIAAANGVTLKALLSANQMNVASAIFPGTLLALPTPTLAIPAPSAPAPTALAPATSGPAAASAPRDTMVATLLAFLHGELGKPYLFNSAGPDAYDCSGLVVAAYRQIGVDLPHQSLLQSQKGTNVDWRTTDIQAGDLIFQIGIGKTIISHVGIAISATQWIQSARAGDVVKISAIPADDRIQAVRRILG